MMCIACQQEFMWLAYLESRGLNASDSPATARSPFAPFSGKPSLPSTESTESSAADKNDFACDDPTGG
jgi:hypothetical protein